MIVGGLRRLVRLRAGGACEYCGLLQEHSPLAALHIEHIIPRTHGGTDDPDNLAAACIDCNLAKGSNLAGLDPATGEITKLFHPRTQRWNDHFKWQGAYLMGKTPVGRATIVVLQMNSDEQVQLRLALRIR
jgi:5-methylcytosine-specific restriction endonuclease McrA